MNIREMVNNVVVGTNYSKLFNEGEIGEITIKGYRCIDDTGMNDLEHSCKPSNGNKDNILLYLTVVKDGKERALPILAVQGTEVSFALRNLVYGAAYQRNASAEELEELARSDIFNEVEKLFGTTIRAGLPMKDPHKTYDKIANKPVYESFLSFNPDILDPSIQKKYIEEAARMAALVNSEQ